MQNMSFDDEEEETEISTDSDPIISRANRGERLGKSLIAREARKLAKQLMRIKSAREERCIANKRKKRERLRENKTRSTIKHKVDE